jgi:hypothetical protein
MDDRTFHIVIPRRAQREPGISQSNLGIPGLALRAILE